MALNAGFFGCARETYKIIGSIDCLPGEVTLYVDEKPVQSVATEDGTFGFEGRVDAPSMAYLTTPKGYFGRFVLTNDELKIDTTPGGEIVLTGSPLTDRYNKIRRGIEENNERCNERLMQLAKEEDWDAYDEAADMRTAELKRVINENHDIVGAMLLDEYWGLLDPEEVLELIEAFPAEMRSNVQLAELLAVQMSLGEGRQYIDFTMPDADGKMHTVSDYLAQGKYVVLDFWATWCAPCMAQMPAMKRLYNKYRDKGVEIIGISMDKDAELWQKTYAGQGMDWVQVCSLKEFDDPVAVEYGVHGVPVIMLIAPDGTILYRGLQEAGVGNALAEIFE